MKKVKYIVIRHSVSRSGFTGEGRSIRKPAQHVAQLSLRFRLTLALATRIQLQIAIMIGPPEHVYSSAAAFLALGPLGFLSTVFLSLFWLLFTALALATASFLKSGRYPFEAVFATTPRYVLRWLVLGPKEVTSVEIFGCESLEGRLVVRWMPVLTSFESEVVGRAWMPMAYIGKLLERLYWHRGATIIFQSKDKHRMEVMELSASQSDVPCR